MQVVVTILISLLLTTSVHAATYYVDRSIGSNGYSAVQAQSEATPWLSIAQCVNYINTLGGSAPGSVCLVKNGIYPEPWTVTVSGASGNPIIIKNYPNHNPHIRFQTTDPTTQLCAPTIPPCPPGSYKAAVGTFSPSAPVGWVEIEGFEVSNGYNGLPCQYCHHTTYRNISCHHQFLGCWGGRGTQVTITQSKAYHSGRFAECAAFPSGGGPSGVNVCNQDQLVYGTGTTWNITNNLVYDGLSYAIQIADYAVEPGATADYGGANNWLVANNTVAYQNNRGAVNYGCYTGTTSGTKIYNNIFYENSQNYGGSANAVEICSASVTNEIRNNVSYATVPGTTSFILCTFSCTNNVHYTDSGNSTLTSPNMVNAPSTVPIAPDFALTSSSTIAIDQGLNLLSSGVTVDYLGTTRPVGAGFDIGAYEFNTGDVTPPAPPTNLRITRLLGVRYGS